MESRWDQRNYWRVQKKIVRKVNENCVGQCSDAQGGGAAICLLATTLKYLNTLKPLNPWILETRHGWKQWKHYQNAYCSS